MQSDRKFSPLATPVDFIQTEYYVVSGCVKGKITPGQNADRPLQPD